ncbi:proton-conducting transporter membrane subunit [Cerasicoccus fimbriatus]|uniref:proton-conducting transporter transmembrane domain-containing protein n=1 Tax=Cerasicoccus fimbriatus TaxID=3014554 RepID=UPI0022B5A777|nr:proton-conducting transporter membrane subunit [Cerasicoccus sp. TK19100]
MNWILTTMVGWMPLAFLAFICSKSAWLNAEPVKLGKLAERLAWAATLCSGGAYLIWLLTGQVIVSTTLTDAGLIGLRLDALSLPILCLICFLGGVILRFSRNYLSGDAGQGNLFKWMLVTLGAVMSLALAPGLVQFWLSWVVCSMGLHHLLVYFPDRLGTLLSARKKFVVSRLGDLCLIIAFTGIYQTFGTQNFSELFALAQSNPGLIAGQAWIGWLVVFGALMKSAQFPFHTWLPDTMGTPTPVSALMHAGIINAGGFLVIRLSSLIVYTPSALSFLAIIGAVTLAFASLIMLTQNSIKRSLAFSTIAQMGFMMLQCGLGAFSLAALHLVAHSLYKAHAFLSSGSTVATLKQLEVKSQAPVEKSALLGLGLLSLGLVSAFAWLFGLNPVNKPGLLVFLAVLTMAVSQFLIAWVRHHSVGQTLVKPLALASGFVALYLGLTEVTLNYFQGTLPLAPIGGLAFQATLTCGLVAVFILSILAQNQSLGRSGLARALYVHALNGFYLNTIANRLSRAIGLVPAGR